MPEHSLPSGLTVPPGGFRRKHSGLSMLGRAGCIAVLGAFLLMTTLCSGLVGLDIFVGTPPEFVLAAVLASLTAVPYCAVLLWLDRNEKEPLSLIITALLWGAATATFISGTFNGLFGAVALDAVNDPALANQLTASLSAPFVEEGTKGFAVMMLFMLFHKQFDNVLDGVLYGALIGLGFAWFENITYYVDAAKSGGLGGMLALAWARGVVSGLGGSHAAYTALTGLGFGLVRVLRRGILRWLLVPLFWGMAMFAHFSWNTFVGFFTNDSSAVKTLLVDLPIATIVLQGPFLLLLIIVVVVVWRRENRIILTHLIGEPPDVVTDAQRLALVPARRRSLAGVGRLFTAGPLAWWRQRRVESDLIRLAFTRWHLSEDDDTAWSADDDAEIRGLRERLRRQRRVMG